MQFDFIIVGGGMVGASLAHALRGTNTSVALIDAAPLNTHDDPRLIALNYSSYQLFTNLHLWEAMAPYATVIKQVHVSDRGHFGKIRLKAEEMGLDALGYVVPAKYINKVLNTNLPPNVTVIRPGRLKQISQTTTYAMLKVETDKGGIELNGKFIIAADGTHSTVREQLNIPVTQTDYHQSALVTITELPKTHNHIAYERFHSTGAVAMLPLTGNRSATIWTDKKEKIDDLMQQHDNVFLETLQKQFGYHLGRLKNIGKRFVFPLHMIQSAETVHQRVVLLGNAAHTLHPIAAQGLNLALAEVAMLADLISENSEQPQWQNYQAWQQKRQSGSIRLSHQLPWLFSQDVSLVNLARQIGMIGLNICPMIKRQFAWNAMGKTGQLPSLLRERI